MFKSFLEALLKDGDSKYHKYDKYLLAEIHGITEVSQSCVLQTKYLTKISL